MHPNDVDGIANSVNPDHTAFCQARLRVSET